MLVRTDLTPAQQIVQAAHAAPEAGFLFQRPPEHPNLVMLAVDDEYHLLAVRARLEAAGIEHAVFHEPDYNLGYTAIATRPICSKQERKFFRNFTLWTVDRSDSLRTGTEV